jgi:hypothetical protein
MVCPGREWQFIHIVAATIQQPQCQ